MRRGEYIQTVEGYRSEYRKRQLQRVILLLEQEPRSKNAITRAERLSFQRELLQLMSSRKRRPYRSGIAVDINFSTTTRNPPELHTLAKSYLDLFQQADPALGVGRRHLLCLDDRQVEVLSVSAHHAARSSRVEVDAQSMADLRSDLELLDVIRSNSFRDDDHPWRSNHYFLGLFDEEQDPFPVGQRRDSFGQMMDWIASENWIVQRYGRAAYDGMLHTTQFQAQQDFLATNENWVHRVVAALLSARSDRSGDPLLEKLAASMSTMHRKFLFTPPVTLDLMHSPTRTGDTKRFRNAIDAALKSVKRTLTWMFPLRTLLSVLIVVVRPGVGIDLDNLARKIVPRVHAILKPPVSLAVTFPPKELLSGPQAGFWKEEIEAVKRAPKLSITRYEVFALPRLENDPAEGFVRISLGDGLHGSNFRRKITRAIGRWEDSVS